MIRAGCCRSSSWSAARTALSWSHTKTILKLANATRDELSKALLVAQEKVQKSMQGKLVRSKEIALEKQYPGREYEFEIPTAAGQYRSRSYLVKGRLYQVIVVGKREFVASKDADRFMDSFKLQK